MQHNNTGHRTKYPRRDNVYVKRQNYFKHTP